MEIQPKYTEAEAKAKAEESRNNGWAITAGDSPEEALKGYAACKYFSKSTGLPLIDGYAGPNDSIEQFEIFQWAMFDKPLQKDVQVVSASEIAALIKTSKAQVAICDDPMRREIGFVWYYLEDGVARTRRVPLTKLKAAPPEVRDVIMQLRDKLMPASK